MKPHKHAELIKAWADGAEIEYRFFDDGEWNIANTPSWKEGTQYRIKPEPDQISYLLLNYPHKHTWFESNHPCEHDCIKIVRDRKTGKLKAAEVL
jgi:hypothetical protein